MIDEKILDELLKEYYKYQNILNKLKEDYELTQGKKGFKLHVKTKEGSADIYFSDYDGRYHCSYEIKNSDDKIVNKKTRNFEHIALAKSYLVRICYTVIYSQLDLGNN